jgi:hypothetical protein
MKRSSYNTYGPYFQLPSLDLRRFLRADPIWYHNFQPNIRCKLLDLKIALFLYWFPLEKIMVAMAQE